jgi:2,4-dienoyl-CoA reductase-like NADH-dependent reductase (Old Yellow Enzyme family)
VSLRAPFDPRASTASGDANRSEADRSLDDLSGRLDRGEFDLIALGRTLLTNPDWPRLVREGRLDALRPYDASARDVLH